ncbi:leucyl aminopeptidase [Spiractinospora alimapuensis]|uniref:leucyl aminopeptidase n=1 Tax=Spiractinospora alimapuensis TaxID=2820884 RepID=UPI001EEB5E0A|nr:leucyl aminopeptidase [Spiractinospora alimapuensis]QVQ53257.1 leucyl aminopeptidase [Spiractinospora alimapuensis]
MSTVLTVTADSPETAQADALVVGYHSSDSGPVPAPGAENVDAAFPGGLASVLTQLGAKGTAQEVHTVPSMGAVSASVVVAVGLGPASDAPEPESVARAVGAAVRGLREKGSGGTVVVAVPAHTSRLVEFVATGALLGGYDFLRYRTNSDAGAGQLEEVRLVSSAEGAADAAERGRVLAESVSLARDLVNTAPVDLTPEDLALAANEVAREHGLGIEILDEQRLIEGGYGGITAVGMGSSNPPRLVRLSYEHPEASRTVALVGKGITFDSGGLSLKPSTAMEWMKSDMGGAAAVLATLRATALLRPAVNVVGYLAIAENMPSGTAQRPSDVLRVYGGTTVEVLNTDAEGRLVMADALVRAQEDSPDIVVDVATLTGAQLVALGTRVFGVMSNDAELRGSVVSAADTAGEDAWPMPLPAELRKGLDSSVADIANVPGERWGGMLVAGLFLQEFVADGVPWAHLDIAGPAFNQGSPHGYTPKGGTGAATRTLVGLIEAQAAQQN